MGWKRVTRIKIENCFGLRTTRLNNEALLSKMCWKILQQQECVWTDFIQAKYLKNVWLSKYIVKLSDSPTWKGIVRCMALISSFIRWKIGTGKKIFLSSLIISLEVRGYVM